MGENSYGLSQKEIQAIFQAGQAVKYKPPTNVQESEQLPNKFELMQNYPNPFNPATTIRFLIPQLMHVTLQVFDVLGREIATLFNKEVDAGEHSVIFNAGDLPSGIYFYRLQAGKFVQQRKMVLIK